MLGPPLCPRRVLVGANARAIHEVDAPVHLASRIGLALGGGEDAVPDPRQPPAAEATVQGVPRTVSFGHIAPRGARPDLPEDAVEHPPMVDVRAARLGLLGWQERRQGRPPLVGQFMASNGHPKPYHPRSPFADAP